MDKKFEEIAEQIEVLKFRIDTEIEEIREKFAELTTVATKKKSSQKKKQYTA